MATPASSDLQVSSSSAWSSNHLIPSSLKLPSISHPWTFSPSTLLSSSPLPPETFLSQQMPPQSPCRAQTALLFPPLCPQLPSLQQLHMTEPILLSWFSMERKSLCFEGCFKNSPRHIQYLFRRGDPPPPQTTTNVSQIQTRSSSYASLVICWWRNMMYFTSSYPPKESISQICCVTLWEGARNTVREHKAICG